MTIWSRLSIEGQGTPDTCYADEFYRSGTPTWEPNESSEKRILRCDDCDCSVGQLTSRQGQTCIGGRDILVGGGLDCSEGNFAVAQDEFPCDIFQHVFGVQARTDEDGDNFCEHLVTAEDPENPSSQVGVDELYLADKADWVVSTTTGFGERFAGDARLIDCDTAMTKTGGLIWIRDETCRITGEVGTPEEPVLIVYDGGAHINAGVVFGMLFVRSTGTADLAADFGGNASLQANGGVALYGAVVVQGQATQLNGTGAIVHNSSILEGLRTSLGAPDVFGLPGSWSDSVSY